MREFLSSQTNPPMLFAISVIADRAAASCRKTDLFQTLDPYTRLLPAGYTVRFSETGPLGSVLRVYRRGEEPRSHVPVPGVFDAGVDMGPPRRLNV